MEVFYQIFSRSGIKTDQVGQQAIVSTARNCWVSGHPLLREIADAGRWDSRWPAAKSEEVFGGQFFASSSTLRVAPEVVLQYQALEHRWREAGRRELPTYFGRFGVLNARDFSEELIRKAHEEAKARHQRMPSTAEQRSIKILTDAVRDLAPAMMKVFDDRSPSYSVAETETILGELKEKRSYHQSRDVFLSSSVFVADFPEALAVVLHEHSHIFGYDGSRGFTDALTELLETVVRERRGLDHFEGAWNQARDQVKNERAAEKHDQGLPVEKALDSLSEAQLRELIKRLPVDYVRRAMKQSGLAR